MKRSFFLGSAFFVFVSVSLVAWAPINGNRRASLDSKMGSYGSGPKYFSNHEKTFCHPSTAACTR